MPRYVSHRASPMMISFMRTALRTTGPLTLARLQREPAARTVATRAGAVLYGVDAAVAYAAGVDYPSGMVRRFSAVITQEGGVYVAQCLDVDVVSDGTTEEEALAHLREALELYFEDSPGVPEVRQFELEIPAARVG